MNRSAGVVVIAVISLLGSALVFLMGVLMLVLAFVMPIPSQGDAQIPAGFGKAIFILGSLVYLLPAIWGIASGIGLWGMKNWARISTIVFSVLLLLMGGFDFVVFLLIPVFPTSTASGGAIDPAIMSAMRFGMAGFSLAICCLGIWWLVYLTRASVKQQFIPIPSSYPVQDSALFPRPNAQSKPQRPLSFTVLAWFLLVCCLFFPLSMLMHAPAVFLTKIVTGWPASIYALAMTAACFYIGIGLLRFQLTARLVAIGYFAFAVINSAVFFLAPGRSARVQALLDRQQEMFPWMQSMQGAFRPRLNMAPMIILGSGMGLIFTAVVLYFLITRKQAFETAAAAR
jgi:hypothetical protein